MTRNACDHFEFSGFAAASDLLLPRWKSLFSSLEVQQLEFAEGQAAFRSAGYRWPLDPLHTWSRPWEYAYVFHHVIKDLDWTKGAGPRVIDYGSGVTFFPFALARAGCRVTCVDIDPICAVDIPRAFRSHAHAPGEVGVGLVANGIIPVGAASQDVVYCISVLEHIPDFDSVVDEMARVLRPNGRLVLTVDVGLSAGLDIGTESFERLLEKLHKHFTPTLPERPTHPRNLLTSTNSPYGSKSFSGLHLMKRCLKAFVFGDLRLSDALVEPALAVYAAVLARRES